MEEGTFLGWKKQEGEFIRAGEPLYELESEKATQEVEAIDSGFLRLPPGAPAAGDVVAVGALLGYLLAEGESLPQSAPPTSIAPQSATAAAPRVATEPRAAAVAETRPAEPPPAAPAPPSVRRLARKLGVDLSRVVGSGSAGRVTADDLHSHQPPASATASAPAADRVCAIASPRARRVAAELGIDWSRIRGTGRSGRIRERDVRAAAAQTSRTGKSGGAGRRQPISSRRRTIAQRMLASQQQTAPVTLTSRVDATNLVNLRTQFKSLGAGAAIPSYTDMIVKLSAAALEQHPLLGARWEHDHVLLADALDIGIAVDTAEGLIVPVVRDVPRLTLLEFAEHSRMLIERAQAGKLAADDMRGGVFTVTNLGAFGIDAFTPIINTPETAILGVGCIRREPAVHNDQVVPRDQLTLSLTFDHRIVDGAPAARFLQTLVQAIENPSAWLLRSM